METGAAAEVQDVPFDVSTLPFAPGAVVTIVPVDAGIVTVKLDPEDAVVSVVVPPPAESKFIGIFNPKLYKFLML
jgi:hypothetical protein